MKTIVHVINNLSRGGAETLLVDFLPELSKHYNIVLVTIEGGNDFGEVVTKNCYKYYCLNHKGALSYFYSVRQLRKIIKEYNPVLIRSQLVLSTLIARLASPSEIPLVFSIHNPISKDLGRGFSGVIFKILEKVTLRSSNTMIGVSQEAIDDYHKNFSIPQKTYLLYNYVRQSFFSVSTSSKNLENKLNMISVGNLKKQKNYPYIVEAFRLLKDLDINLDVYGDGPMREELQNQIDSYGLKIYLKGKESNISSVISKYDVFILTSTFEGFGIVVAEAMASGKPLILSDLEVFKEVTHGNAFFVDISSPQSLVAILREIYRNKAMLEQHIEINKKIASENYSQEVYLKKLLEIYQQVLKN